MNFHDLLSFFFSFFCDMHTYKYIYFLLFYKHFYRQGSLWCELFPTLFIFSLFAKCNVKFVNNLVENSVWLTGFSLWFGNYYIINFFVLDWLQYCSLEARLLRVTACLCIRCLATCLFQWLVRGVTWNVQAIMI